MNESNDNSIWRDPNRLMDLTYDLNAPYKGDRSPLLTIDYGYDEPTTLITLEGYDAWGNVCSETIELPTRLINEHNHDWHLRIINMRIVAECDCGETCDEDAIIEALRETY